MTKKLKILVIVGVLTGSIAAVNVATNDKLYEISKNLEIFINVYRELNTNFVDELDPGTMMRTAIDAMTKSLDPYTNYISESQIASYQIYDDDKYQGIGAKVGLVGESYKIIEPYEGGPAVNAGLKAGDVIVGIDGVNIQGKNIEEINSILRGIPGTDIKMEVRKLGESKTQIIKVVRGEVNIPNVPYSGYVADGIGYVSLTVFTQEAAGNVAKAIKELKAKNPNLSGIVLDLRQNGGGLLREAIALSNLFIPKDEIVVTTKGKIKERDEIFKTMGQPFELDLPLAVLIDGRSASASEIVSGVMQDLDRGVLIGQRSYGKGLVQNTREVGFNSRLKLTTSKYYIPSGRCIQGVEYANGEPVDIPESQRTKFKTRGGRVVLDGGGVLPDVKLPAPTIHPVTKALLDQYLIFEYVNEYCKGKDSIAQVGSFKFDDYDGFLAFVRKNNFKYQLESEKNLEKVIADLEKVESSKIALDDAKKLKDKINSSKVNDFTVAKNEIIDQIEKEIVTRYYFQKGKVQQTLDDDPEVAEAIAILRDSNRYKKLLGKK
jgi:carboxyl-terminal processing protease